MTITSRKPFEQGDVLLACTDGMWTGSTDEQLAVMATRKDEPLAENLKAISLRALAVNAPYSDNTTGTAVRWIGD